MQVSTPNNVKIYNLSCGRSIPEWFSSRQRRRLKRKDPDIERSIQLIQDFQMPGVTHCIQMSENGQYIGITGVYKPKFRLFDMNHVSLKVERGLDSGVVKFRFLKEDYTKIVFLQEDRYVEFHDQVGRHHRLRLPKYGRDFDYHEPSAVLYFVGVGPEVYRLDLEMGSFREPMITDASEVYCCQFNKEHYLFACGTKEGKVEFWDARAAPKRAGIIDTAFSSHLDGQSIKSIPSVTSLKYRNAYEIGIGTSTGHVLLYDIRSSRPYLVKDHYYNLGIRNILFHRDDDHDLVLSMDRRILKLWDRETGEPYTAVEPGVELNDVCQVPKSGLIFMAAETQQVQTFFIPSLGAAPKWCSHLENITEDLEEVCNKNLYDGVKFVERWELEQLGLTGLIGSNLLRAGLHGYFMSEHLYAKVKDPFVYEKYREEKIRQKIEATREDRVKLKKLPKVNRALAEKLVQEATEKTGKKKKDEKVRLDQDDRFADLFKDPAFQIDPGSEEFMRLNPVVSKQEKKRKEREMESLQEQMESEPESESSSDSASLSSVTDNEHHASDNELMLPKPKWSRTVSGRKPASAEQPTRKKVFVKIQEADQTVNTDQKTMRKSLAERLKEGNKDSTFSAGIRGNKEMTFSFGKKKHSLPNEDVAKHKRERKEMRRSGGDILQTLKSKPKFWMGQRVK